MRRRTFARIIDALMAAALAVAAIMIGLIDDIDLKASDWLYQKAGEKNPDIVVIGIDPATLDKLGPLPVWGRREMAKAIDILNNSTPESRPRVIGVDVVFSGSNRLHPEYDEALSRAAGEHGNVVVASMADINENLNPEAKANDPFYPWDETWPWDAPYAALAAVAETGHINPPKEKDGIVRHALLYVNVEERGRLPSFARAVYEKWCEKRGINTNSPPVTDVSGIFYVPFRSDSYDCGFSFLDLIDGRIPPDVYRGKIVLIGPYAAGMRDEYPTAIERSGLMYGIDIHANVIDAFDGGFLPREARDDLQLVLTFIVIFFSQIFFRSGATTAGTALEGKMRRVVLWWLAVSLGWIGLCQACYAAGWILHAAWVPFSVSVVFVGAVMTNHYVHAKEEETRIDATFARYFDPAVMRELLSGSPDFFKLGGKPRDIAVLFVDIRGFTAMSEKIPASSVVEILNSYLDLTTKAVYRYHGTVDKFIGDAVMAFWNAPLEQKDPVLLACLAALDMVAGSRQLATEARERFGVDISVGIGIHWGDAVVGNIGTARRMDYTAIGDTVNTASRLESNAEGGEILISRAVADALGGRGETERLKRHVTLKGKEENFEILVLKSLKNDDGEGIRHEDV